MAPEEHRGIVGGDAEEEDLVHDSIPVGLPTTQAPAQCCKCQGSGNMLHRQQARHENREPRTYTIAVLQAG